MALQQINWLQIDTANVPSGSTIDLGAISGALHAVYAKNLYVSGQNVLDFLSLDDLNSFTSSVNASLEFTG